MATKVNKFFENATSNFVMRDRCCKAIQVVFEKYYDLYFSKGYTAKDATEKGFYEADDCIMPPIWDNINLCRAFAAYHNKCLLVVESSYYCYVIIGNKDSKPICCVNAANVKDCKKQCERLWGKINWDAYTITKVLAA